MPFLPLLISWRWGWREAWVYGILSVLSFVVSRLLVARRHPDLIAERARFIQHEDAQSWDKELLPLMGLAGILVLVVAGLDKRLGWSPAFSLPVKILALALIVGGYILTSYALIENRFFSGMARLQTDRGQQVVSSGPYRWMRHPGYAGALLMHLVTPPFFSGLGTGISAHLVDRGPLCHPHWFGRWILAGGTERLPRVCPTGALSFVTRGLVTLGGQVVTDDLIYHERVSSNRTEGLFLALMSLCFLLFLWRVIAGYLDVFAAICFCFFGVFLFYSVNYRTLLIRLTTESLSLTFGIFTWEVPLENVEACRVDSLPLVMKYGGAGIHFMFIRGRYRASFNFLEYPRVVIAFKRKAGPVRDISFSTRRPDDVLRLLQEAVSAEGAT